LYEPVAKTVGKRGRPRKKGKRLPKRESILENKKTIWQRLVVQEWYGEKNVILRSAQMLLCGITMAWIHCSSVGFLFEEIQVTSFALH
jgi:hypothetical protein